MKIAITADLHLTTRSQHPERYNALANILDQMLSAGISTLIIAGDLFDETSSNYNEFDALCQQPKFKGLRLVIIPGNHDAELASHSLTASNVEVLSEPTLQTFGAGGLKFLFLPFARGQTMGDHLVAFADRLPANEWALISHGDWAEGMRDPNPYEPGVYMPLTRMDIEIYKPAKVILGHIHKPWDSARVHYAGSPCGLAINETGRRRFLILDAETGAVTSRIVAADVLFFNEVFVALPVRDETEYIQKQIAERIKGWGITPAEFSKVRLQARVIGYCTNKRALQETINGALAQFAFHRDLPPDLSEVSEADDIHRAEIAQQVSAWIEKLDWDAAPDQPDKDQILLEALHVIYGN